MSASLTILGLSTILALTACKKDPVDTGDSGGTDGGSGDGGAASGDLLWLTTGGGPADEACGSAVDGGNGVLVATCSFAGFTTWGEGTAGELDLTSVGESDAVFLGLDATDGSILWNLPVGSDGPESADVAVSARLTDGRVAALLELGGPATVSGAELDDVIAGDNVLFLLDPAGTVDGATRLTAGPAFEDIISWSLEPLPGGGLLVGGGFEGELTLLPGSPDEQTLTGLGSYDMIVARLDADLNLDGLLHLQATDGGVVGKAVPLDDGGVVVAGWFSGSLTLGQTNPTTLTANPAPDSGDAFVAALDADGEPRWALAFGSDGEDMVRGLVRTSNGGIVTAGYFNYGNADSGVLTVPGLDGLSLQGDDDHNADLFVLGLASDGTPQWLQGLSSTEIDTAVHVDAFADGGVVVSGYVGDNSSLVRDSTLTFSDGETVELSATTAALVRYDADGSRLWTNLSPVALGIAGSVLDDDAVAQGGWFQSGAIYGGGQTSEVQPLSAGSSDAAVAVYGP